MLSKRSLSRSALVQPIRLIPIVIARRNSCRNARTRWLAFYAENVEPVFKEIVSHIEKIIIGTLIVSAGAHVSSNEPAISLFGYLRHGLVGRGVMLIGIIILLLNFIDGLYKLRG